jgi:DNA-binding protein HU-beta
MIKSDIINNVARIADITRVRAVVAVEAILDAMKESMRKGERIEVKPRKKGIGRNPRTGTEVRIPPGKTIRFKPGKNLRNLR